MLNQVVLVGKVRTLPTLKETQSGIKLAELMVEVERNFKNSQGIVETDDIQCTLWRGLAETALSQCQLGSLVGIRGRVQAAKFDTKEDKPFHYCEVIVEKITFLHPSDMKTA
jgi:single-strand DNA-binding protein